MKRAIISETLLKPVRTTVASNPNKVLRDALKSIYQVYGSDLSAFFRDTKDVNLHEERNYEGRENRKPARTVR